MLRSKQESHIKHFLQTEAASRAGRVAEEQTSTLRNDVQGSAQLALAAHSFKCCIDINWCARRQAGLQGDLIKTKCEVAGSKAVIAVVQAQMVTSLHWLYADAYAAFDLIMYARKAKHMHGLVDGSCSDADPERPVVCKVKLVKVKRFLDNYIC